MRRSLLTRLSWQDAAHDGLFANHLHILFTFTFDTQFYPNVAYHHHFGAANLMPNESDIPSSAPP